MNNENTSRLRLENFSPAGKSDTKSACETTVLTFNHRPETFPQATLSALDTFDDTFVTKLSRHITNQNSHLFGCSSLKPTARKLLEYPIRKTTSDKGERGH